MELSNSLRALSVVVLASAASAQGVRIVDATGTRNFDTLQQAVDASFGGELLLVAAGDYAGFTIDGKSVDILVKPGAFAVVRGQVTIRNLAGQDVLLSGLQIQPPSPNFTPLTPGLEVINCAGHVRVQQCTIFGANGTSGSNQSGQPAVVANGADQLVLSNCSLTGGAGGSLVGLCGPTSSRGGAGITASSSRVAMYHTTALGGFGGNNWESYGGKGGAGAELQASIGFGSACFFFGGNGGGAATSEDCTWLIGGDGGVGLSIGPGSDMTGLANTHSGGTGGSGVGGPGMNAAAIANSGVHTLLPGVARSLIGPRYGSDGALITMTISGLPGERVHLMRSLTLDFAAALSLSGYWLIHGPFFLSRGGQGVIAPTGALHLPTRLPDLSGPVVQRRQSYQSLVKGVSSDLLTGPWHIPTIQSSPAPDCNGNGVNDFLEALSGSITDCNHNLIADSCELATHDCNSNGVPDDCDLASGTSPDVNHNGIPDECEVFGGPWYVDDSAPPGGNGSLGFPFQTLRLAFNAALSGHTILVQDGVYAGADNRNLDFLTRNLVVRSLHGASSCIIDCGGVQGAFSATQGQTNASLIEGFTIRNAAGGAVTCYSSAAIKDCVIEMGPLGAGPGLGLRYGSPLVQGCRLIGNAQSGPGIDCWLGTFLIVDTHIEGFLQSHEGGGISIDGGSGTESRISHCTIVGNHALYGGLRRGGGISAQGYSSVVVENCLIAGNLASRGGAIFGGQLLSVINCTIVDNRADFGPALDLYTWVSSMPGNRLIADSILWNNRAPTGVEQVRIEGHPGALPIALWPRWSDIQFGSAAITTIGSVTTQYGPFNIDEDPLFVDRDGPDNDPLTVGDNDYRLGGTTGCLDSGAKLYVAPDWFDLDQDGDVNEPVPFDLDFLRRFVDLPAVPNTGQGTLPYVDMGCFEKQL